MISGVLVCGLLGVGYRRGAINREGHRDCVYNLTEVQFRGISFIYRASCWWQNNGGRGEASSFPGPFPYPTGGRVDKRPWE